MCGREVASGILCEKCDKPRRRPATETTATSPRPETSNAHALDSFPPAPVLPFPVESASPAITSIVNLLVASGVPSFLLGPDRSVKFVSDAAIRLFDASKEALSNLKFVEANAAIAIGDLSMATSAGTRVRNRNVIYSLVPMTGGAGGAVLIFRYTDPMDESHASFVNYIHETVTGPLTALGESLRAAATSWPDPLLTDSAATIDQILTSLELAPRVNAPSTVRPVPTVTHVVRRVADRFTPLAEMKGVQLQIDAQDLQERFEDHERLADSMTILLENALHYVPSGGTVVAGVRWMEHKGKPLLLFFVIDNGPIVPEELRQTIFDPSFVWSPTSPERAGRGLFKVREFALAHSGSVWVESRTGKACTFFLRVRPDGR
ncbi:MAG TPA: HAMP domain-containing sensor histidine kinase [Thermoanaerobaculia bacterium]|nr:HAMP domain-containing sensor histidine kinase [Thermoanaerobaculia bacterium]